MRKTIRRRRIERAVAALTEIRGVDMAFVEYDPVGEEGHRWSLTANTRTGEKTVLCRNLAECEAGVEELRRICIEESRLSDAECEAIVDRALRPRDRRAC